MNYIYIILIGIILLGLLIGLYQVWKNNALFCFGIGGAINANFFNIASYPLIVGPFTFGIDSALYTIFTFCLIFYLISEGEKSGRNFNYCVVGGIVFLCIAQLIASLSTGDVSTLGWTLGSYLISALATILCSESAIFSFSFFKKKKLNIYLNVFFSMLISMVINSIIYFGLTFLFFGAIANFGLTLSASLIGKTTTICLCIIALCLILHIQKKKELKSSKNN